MNRRAVPTVGRWAPGATGEERVGTILDALGPHDWRPIHEVDTGHGNIDHVLVGPAGVLWELLHLDGRSVRQLPLVERQPVLSGAAPGPRLGLVSRPSRSRGRFDRILEILAEHELEGLIATDGRRWRGRVAREAVDRR